MERSAYADWISRDLSVLDSDLRQRTTGWTRAAVTGDVTIAAALVAKLTTNRRMLMPSARGPIEREAHVLA